ncbi:MAG: Mrp/NBP35 family ATP-binding protein [Bacteroidetes bacterium]|nr:Mrp/NBP35 family ATP-binding protein [Bacteroidota bacterium]
MSIDKTRILEALKQVKDPLTGRNVVEANMVEELVIDGGIVNFTLVLPSLQNEHKQDLNFACISAIQKEYPFVNVNVHMMARTADAQQTNSSVPQIKNIIAVASGKGGVGKSTVSTNLALGLQKLGAKVGILDADLYGPSIPTMLGLKGQKPKIENVYGSHKILPLEAYGLPVMSIGFIVEAEQAVVMRGPRLGAIIGQFINDVLWPELDYLVIDLPPGTGDIQLTLVQTVSITGAIMVTTPQEVAVADALKAMNMFLLPSVDVPILGVVENMSWFTPEELPENKYFLFGKGGGMQLAQEGETYLLGQIPIVQGVREGGDKGEPIILKEDNTAAYAFMELAKNTILQVKKRNETQPPTQIVQIEN